LQNPTKYIEALFELGIKIKDYKYYKKTELAESSAAQLKKGGVNM